MSGMLCDTCKTRPATVEPTDELTQNEKKYFYKNEKREKENMEE